MSHRTHLKLESAVSRKLDSAGRKRGSLRGACGVRMLEELESRVLLSHSPFFAAATAKSVNSATRIMYPDFILQRGTPDLLGSIEGYTPAEITQAYGINQVNFGGIAGDGSGQTIAIVDAYSDPTLRTDLHTFDQQFGLSDPQLTIINQNGGTILPGTDPAGPGDSWAEEISLDVEWAHAVAPGANILLVLANSPSSPDLDAAILTARSGAGVSVVSMSFGGAESSSDAISNKDFTTPTGHNGVTFIASAGDEGAFGTGGTVKTTQFPASSPNVVAVGGTRLVLANGTYGSETGWGSAQTSGSLGGGGGGVSKFETQPIYQKGVVTQTSIFRGVPDVAFDADPATGVAIVDSWDSPSEPWTVVGGTSLAAPMWSAVVAIADQGRTLAGEGTLDGATQTLPALYKLPSADFHDVTVGNNGFLAGVGYDLVTGLGTPIVNLVVRDLVTPPGTVPAVVNGPVIGSLSITPGTVSAGTPVTLSAENVAELGNGTVSNVKFYEDTNGVQGFQLGSDLLLGTGTQDGSTWNFTFSTSNITASGDYTFYAVATDNASVTSNTIAQTLTITAPTFTLDVKADSVVQTGETVTINTLPFVTAVTVNAGTLLTLTATNATEEGGGTIANVVFTRALVSSNGTIGSPVTIGSGIRSVTDWSIGTNTTGLAAGVYVFTATVTDAAGISTIMSTNVRVVSGPVAPPNDSFLDPLPLSGIAATTAGTNVGASTGTDVLISEGLDEAVTDPSVAGVTGGRSVWWTWTAPVNGTVLMSTAGSDFDTLLGVYINSGFTTTNEAFPGVANLVLTQVAANDDVSQGIMTSGLTFTAAAGTTYMIDVDGFHGASGNIALNLSETPTGAQGTFSTPRVLTGTTATVTGTSVGIPAIIGQPKVASKQGGGQVWFTWTAPSTRTVSLSTQGSSYDTLLGVYKGLALTALTKVASNDDISKSNLASTLTFKATKGVTYRFVIDGYIGASGSYVLNMS